MSEHDTQDEIRELIIMLEAECEHNNEHSDSDSEDEIIVHSTPKIELYRAKPLTPVRRMHLSTILSVDVEDSEEEIDSNDEKNFR